jgi:hypothetical protein
LPVRLLRNQKGVVFSCHGRVTAKEMAEVKTALMARPTEIGSCMFGIVDHTGAERVDYTTADLHKLARLDHALAPYTREGIAVAIVAPRDLEFGLSRMWQAFVQDNGWDTMVFRSRERAEEWVREKVSQNFSTDLDEFPDHPGEENSSSPAVSPLQ